MIFFFVLCIYIRLSKNSRVIDTGLKIPVLLLQCMFEEEMPKSKCMFWKGHF